VGVVVVVAAAAVVIHDFRTYKRLFAWHELWNGKQILQQPFILTGFASVFSPYQIYNVSALFSLMSAVEWPHEEN
jgi:hypothetical protein